MQRLKNFAISIVALALVALPSTTSSHNPKNSPELSPQGTSRPEAPQGSRRPQTKFVKKQTDTLSYSMTMLLATTARVKFGWNV